MDTIHAIAAVVTTPWPLSASELYRQSGRRWSAKLVPTFADRGVSRGQRNGSPRPLISVFWTVAAVVDMTIHKCSGGSCGYDNSYSTVTDLMDTNHTVQWKLLWM